MILGTGLDLVRIDRIERTLDRFGERFLARIFTEAERTRCLARPHPAACLARRFAAKEACAKALGTGFRRGVFWRDLALGNRPGGQPSLQLTGGAALRLQALCPPGWRPDIHVSLTDDPPFAQAMVIVWASPVAPAAGGAGPGK